MPLCANLSPLFSLPCFCWTVSTTRTENTTAKGDTHSLHLLVLLCRLQHGGHVVREAKLLQRLGDVVAGDGLLGLLLRDLVGLGGDEGDELDAALDEEVAGLLGEDGARGGGEDLGDDLLDGCWGVLVGAKEEETEQGVLTLWKAEVVVRCAES